MPALQLKSFSIFNLHLLTIAIFNDTTRCKRGCWEKNRLQDLRVESLHTASLLLGLCPSLPDSPTRPLLRLLLRLSVRLCVKRRPRKYVDSAGFSSITARTDSDLPHLPLLIHWQHPNILAGMSHNLGALDSDNYSRRVLWLVTNPTTTQHTRSVLVHVCHHRI